ncbi:hypothetical protein RJ640_002076 [Escallonia rubra]|uniref:Uncharacterized protein n=1 Tax=Escallonia rubra TaxID=112253 RepID=A0AA88UUP3_9ASTE|nr:hypothetical protein RJ640_031004 [Escallonia rubra]KAK2994883.1 hypothetical protein RJ640_002076 [Escallonia rubra]
MLKNGEKSRQAVSIAAEHQLIETDDIRERSDVTDAFDGVEELLLRDGRSGDPRRGGGGVGRRAEEEGVGPDADEAAEGEVGDDVGGLEDLHGGGARIVAGVEPRGDAGAVVGDAGAEAHRRLHHVH